MLNLSRSLFIATLLLAPFTSVGTGSEISFFIILTTGGALTFFLLHCLKSGHPVYKVPGLLWLIPAAGYMVFQAIPLPLPLLTFLSPETAAVWTGTAALRHDHQAWRLSLDLPGTLNRLALLLTCLGFYWLAVQLLSDRRMLTRLTIIPIFFGSLLALYTLLRLMLPDATGICTEINPAFISSASFSNHLLHASPMVMLFPVTLALVLAYRPAGQFGSLRMRVRGFFEEAETPLFIILCLASLIMALSVFAELLRDGIPLPEWEWPAEGVMIELLLAGFLIALFVRSLRRLATRREPLAIILCYGTMAGIAAAMLCHTFPNWDLRVSANALYFYFLCALMIAASHTRLNPGLETKTCLESAPRRRPIIVLLTGICIWLCLLVFTVGQVIPKGISAIVPNNVDYYIQQGDVALTDGRTGAALAAYDRALWMAPARSLTLQKIGRALFQDGHDMSEADALFRAGVANASGQPDAYHRYAAFLLETNRPETALSQISAGIMTAPERAEMFFMLMAEHGFSPAAIFNTIPDDSRALLKFAAYTGPLKDAPLRERILRRAVAAAENESSPPVLPFLKLADFYSQQGQHSRALGVLEKGVAVYPSDIDLLFHLARTYEHNLIFYKSERLYKKILILDPEHRSAGQRLAEITGHSP